MAKQLNTLSSGDYAKWQYELAMLNSGKHDTINPDDYTKVFGNYQDIDLYENIEGNNWQDQVFGRTGHTFNHNLKHQWRKMTKQSSLSAMRIWMIKQSCKILILSVIT